MIYRLSSYMNEGNITVYHMYAYRYNAQWYEAPVHSQKMLILILRRCAKQPLFNFSTLFAASLEGFGTVILVYKKILQTLH